MTCASEYDSPLVRITDALFCSQLPTGSTPDGKQLSSAVAGALAEYDTWDGCMRAAALAFLEDDTAAAERQLWCERVVVDALGHSTASPLADE